MEIVATTECIFYVKELLPKELCRTIIENFEREPGKHPGYTLGSHGEKRSEDPVKVSTDLGVPGEGVWTTAHDELHRC